MAKTAVIAKEDASVYASHPNANFGNYKFLDSYRWSAKRYYAIAYLKFDVPDLDITKAVLQLSILSSGNEAAGTIWIASVPCDLWSESAITYNTRVWPEPEFDWMYSYDGTSGYWTSIDITDYVKANKGKCISMRIVASTDLVNMRFSSREGTAPPQITITYAEPPPPEKGEIIGKVTNSVTGDPIEGVGVGLNDFTDMTDSSGKYSIQEIPPGTYDVYFIKPDYHDQIISVNIIAGASAVRNIELVPKPPPEPEIAIAHLTSEPSGADIWTFGKDSGVNTPFTSKQTSRIDLDYTYKLTGYEDVTFRATVELGEEKTYHKVLTPVAPPPVKKGAIAGKVTDFLTGNPIEDVDVNLNGYTTITDSAGIYGIYDIPVGFYVVTFSKDEYESEVINVEIKDKVTAFHEIDFVPSYVFPIVGWLAQAKTFILETLPGWLVSIPKVIADTLDHALNISTIFNVTIPNALQKAKDYAKGLVDAIELVIPQWIIDAANSVKTWWDDTVSYVSGQIQNAKDYAYDLVQDIEVIIPQWIIDIVNSVKTWWDDTVSYVTGKIEDVKLWATSAISDAIEWVVKTATDSWNWITATGTDLSNWFNDTAKDAVNWVNDAGINLFNDFTEFKAKIIEHVENAIFYILDKSIEKKEDIREEFRKGMP